MDDNNAPDAPATAERSDSGEGNWQGRNDLILSLPVAVQVVLGSTSLPVAKLLKLGRGAVITLDQHVGDPVDLVVSGRVVARGEVVVIDEENSRYGVSLTQVVNGDTRPANGK
jgi:flagellar motor switch protein FliN/FliY